MLLVAAEWRQVAADLGALAEGHVRAVFAWIDAELAASGSDGAVTLMLALSDWDRGMPFHAVLGELLLWADHARDGVAGSCQNVRSSTGFRPRL